MTEKSIQTDVGISSRILGYDVLRVGAALAVIWYHFDCAIRDGHLVAKWSFPTFNFLWTGFGIANIAVSMFFLLSGALAAGSLCRDKFDSKAWVKKKLLHLYPAFWMSWLVAWLINFLSGHIFRGIPWWRFLLTIAGMDGYVGSYLHIPTYGLVGEWFFGVFILTALLWPLMRKLMRWNYAVTVGIAVALAAAATVVCSFWFQDRDWYAYRSIFFCEMTFLLGLVAVRVSKSKHSTLVGALCLIVPLATRNFFHLSLWSFDTLFIAFGVLVLVGDTRVEGWLREVFSNYGGRPARWLVRLSGLTLWSFLFQHVVIYAVTDRAHALLGDATLGTFDTLGLCIIITIITFCLSYFADRALRALRES